MHFRRIVPLVGYSSYNSVPLQDRLFHHLYTVTTPLGIKVFILVMYDVNSILSVSIQFLNLLQAANLLLLVVVKPFLYALFAGSET